MNLKTIIALTSLLLAWSAHSAELSGRVFSLRTGKAQAGAIVRLVAAKAPDRAPSIPSTVKIVVQGYVATPNLVALQVGDTLQIANADSMGYTVLFRFRANKERSILLYAKGEGRDSTSFTVETPELFASFADELGKFRGSICVVENPVYAFTDSDGAFKLPNLPDGSYTFEAATPREGRLSKTINLSASTGSVDFELPATVGKK